MASKKNKHKRGCSCCPQVSDLLTLRLGSPIFDGNSAVRGLVRARPDGVIDPDENADPFGYRIPDGKVLVVTDLSYYSGFTLPQPPGSLTQVFLGRITVTDELIQNQNLFVTAASFANNGSIGGNVSLRSGLVISPGGFLSASFTNFDLVGVEMFVLGYLASQD